MQTHSDSTNVPPVDSSTRCDRCSARAQVLVILNSGGELVFCGHHARAHAEALKNVAACVQGLDES